MKPSGQPLSNFFFLSPQLSQNCRDFVASLSHLSQESSYFSDKLCVE